MINTDIPPNVIKLLAHDLRWRIVKRLSVGDYRVNELVSVLDAPFNLVSYHLKKLRQEGLVIARRSEADARDTYYRLEIERLGALYRNAGRSLHPSLVETTMMNASAEARPSPIKVLFICTHNSARSQMAEGLLRHDGPPHISVASAGEHPTVVHPDAIQVMDEMGVNIRSQSAKSFDAVIHDAFDYLITVCDRARETCPTFSGDGRQIHWSFPDPALIDDANQRLQAFRDVAAGLRSRIHHLLQMI